MIFLMYTILVILQCKGVTTMVPDPCLSDINSAIVADMCTLSSAMENIQLSGSFNVDSVVLRIMIQDNCICRVTIDNQVQPISIALRKYNGLSTSASTKYGCGLAVDITHIPNISAGNEIAPMQCVENTNFRDIKLLQNSSLQFKSRIIDGNFTRGYCMRLKRDSNSNRSQVLRIDCDTPMTTEQTTRQTIKSYPTTDTSGNVEDPSITTTPQTTDLVESSTVRTTGDTTTTDSTTDTSKKVEHLAMITDPTTGLEQTTYIAIGAGSSVALILLVVLVVICLRRKSTQKAGTNGNVNKSYRQEESDDKLQDNVLYVPAGEFDINGGNNSTADMDTARSSNKRLSMEGNYSTVDEDTPKSSNTRLSMEGNYSTVDVDTPKSSNTRLSMEGNYSTVDDDTPRFANTRLSMEGNCSTVDEDAPRSSNTRLSMEGNYSTVDEDTPKASTNRLSMDGNYSIVELDEHLVKNSSYPENSELGQTKGKPKPTIKPKPNSSCLNSQEHRPSDQNIKHISPPNGSDNIYAVVDKSSKHVPITSGSKGEEICQPDQTYAVVDKAQKCKSSLDETNKKKFKINSGNMA